MAYLFTRKLKLFRKRSGFTPSTVEAFGHYDVDYAATLNITKEQLDHKETFIHLGELTGNLTINCAELDNSHSGDHLYIFLDADGSNRTITYGTNITGAAATFPVALNTSKCAHFIFTGTAYKLVGMIT